jgi:hypothetical protein
MKRSLAALLSILIGVQTIHAQSVGIGTISPHPSAQLDVSSNTKGMLVPRMTSAQRIAIVSPATGLMVYDINSNSFWFWTGIVWQTISSSANTWSLSGNSGTSPATNFIGTTDNKSLLVKVNNQKAGYIGVETNDGNIFWGYQSGNSNIGFSNVAIGIKALYNNISSYNLIAIGDSALFSNTTGLYNTAIGSKSLFSNTSGYSNTGTGMLTLNTNSTGYCNTASGVGALSNNTSGYFNVASGFQALTSNETGYGNTAYGTQTLIHSITANYNAANGFQSLLSNTTGFNNTANGYRALFANTTGAYNTANGSESLYNNSTGDNNTAIGGVALYTNSTGGYNVANGNQALYSNTTGSINTASGYAALSSNTSGAYNTAYGSFSLQNNTTGNLNSGLGYLTMTGNLSNATAIGARAQVDCNNCLVLGSVYDVNGATSNVNVGIGITTPNVPLSFPNLLGKKISLYPGGTGDAGFGVFGNELRINSDYSGADITFGYDNYLSGFRENMRSTGAAGNLLVRGTVTATSAFYTSDIRYKKNLQPIHMALERITQLQGYNYYWKDEEQDSTLQSGVIAQEVQKIFPELVHADNKGYLSVNYVGLIPYLIQSIKEQQEQINQLSKENEELKKIKTEVAELRKMIERL